MTEVYHIIENALTPERCAELTRKFLEESDSSLDPRPGYRHYGLEENNMRDPNYRGYDDLKDAITRAYEHFMSTYDMTYNTFELKRLFGNVMSKGTVNEQHDDDGDVYPDKPDVEEHYSCILMLNDDYEGGELYFTHHGIELKLKTGDLIMFRGNAANLHGVREVLSGDRVNIIIFFRNTHRDHLIDYNSPYPY